MIEYTEYINNVCMNGELYANKIQKKWKYDKTISLRLGFSCLYLY